VFYGETAVIVDFIYGVDYLSLRYVVMPLPLLKREAESWARRD